MRVHLSYVYNYYKHVHNMYSYLPPRNPGYSSHTLSYIYVINSQGSEDELSNAVMDRYK